MSIAELMGIRPIGSGISHNEISWWMAYRSIVPFDNLRFDLYESRLLGLHAGKSPATVRFDPFSPLNDPDWIEEQRQELLENRRKRLEKEAKEKCQE